MSEKVDVNSITVQVHSKESKGNIEGEAEYLRDENGHHHIFGGAGFHLGSNWEQTEHE